MQIVIDIPNSIYANLPKIVNGSIASKRILDCVKNGTPLHKVKAEIDQKQYDFMADGDYNEGVRFGLMLAYQIIDKCKAESEGEKELWS